MSRWLCRRAPLALAALLSLPLPARAQLPTPGTPPPAAPTAAPPPTTTPPQAASPAAPPPPATTPEAPFPPLPQALTRARQHAPSLASARGTVQVARAGYAGARLAPIGNPYTEVVVDRTVGGLGGPALTATLWLPLEVWGQRARRISEIDARVAWSGDALAAARALAAAEAAQAYGVAVVEAERARMFESILATARDEAALYRARVDAGDATEQDATLAALEVARNAVQLAEIRTDVQHALTELARLNGVDLYLMPSPEAPLRPPLPDDEATSPDAQAARSPHVLALQSEARYHQQLRARVVAESKLPVSLMLIGGRGELGDPRIGGGLALTLPVLRYGQAERAQAEADQYRATMQASTQRSAIRSTFTGLRRERRQIALAINEVTTLLEPAGQAAVDAAQAMLKAGKGEMLRLLTARRDLAQLRTRKLDLIKREWALYSQIIALSEQGGG